MILGNPSFRTSDGAACELRFFCGHSQIAIVHYDLVQEMQVTESAESLSFFSARLTAPPGTGLPKLSHADVVEIWTSQAGAPLQFTFRHTVDWRRAEYDSDEETIELEGRGTCSRLVDERCDLSFSGTLPSLLSELCAEHDVVADVTDLANTRAVDFYASAPSAYGAMRLICGAAQLNARGTPSGVQIASIGSAQTRLRKGPVATIGPKDILSAKVESGRRVRKRT